MVVGEVGEGGLEGGKRQGHERLLFQRLDSQISGGILCLRFVHIILESEMFICIGAPRWLGAITPNYPHTHRLIHWIPNSYEGLNYEVMNREDCSWFWLF